MKNKKYFLETIGLNNKVEVTKEEWIRAERSAGFRPKMASDHPEYMNTFATGGFSNNFISGSIKYEEK